MKITANRIQIHVRERGEGDIALVFLHYWGGSSRTWAAVAEALSPRCRTIAIDHRGWGDSDAPEEGYRIGDMADDAEAVIQVLGLERHVLVGHSMGGKVAQLLASRRPAGLRGLVLVAPAPPTPMPLSDEQRATMARAYDSPESVGFVLDHVLTARPLSPALRQQVIEDSLRGAPAAKAAWPHVASLEDISADVASIDAPALVIAGELDEVERLGVLRREVVPRIPGASLRVLPGTGHLSPLEAPLALASALRDFVTELGSA
ncbi:alpha/beta fold hydrolase [Sorangium sp. So ce1389]|uniref:alpha/beta fold hydrolase n=1 Tax=Sorangium sp. So ce1389 TaxID=3133336 RepID=UPI003F63F1C3